MSRDHKVAVITGTSSGIGRAIAERFLSDGYRLVVMARSEPELQEIKRRAPEHVLVVAGDVTKAADLDRLVAETVKTYGSVDVVIPNYRASCPDTPSRFTSSDRGSPTPFPVVPGSSKSQRTIIPKQECAMNPGRSILRLLCGAPCGRSAP